MGTIPVCRFRLSEVDRKQYDRGDEWFTFDHDEILNLTSGQLERLEEEMDYTVVEMVQGFWRRSAKSLRAAMWITRRRAGVQEQWLSFDPHVIQAEWEFVIESEGDARPPDESEPAGQPMP